MAKPDIQPIDQDTLQDLVTQGKWLMVLLHREVDPEDTLTRLIDDDSPCNENYRWFRARLGGPVAEWIRAKHEIQGEPQFVILSHYRGEPDYWVLDDLEGRFEEDLIQFMDDHASAIEMEDEDDDFFD